MISVSELVAPLLKPDSRIVHVGGHCCLLGRPPWQEVVQLGHIAFGRGIERELELALIHRRIVGKGKVYLVAAGITTMRDEGGQVIIEDDGQVDVSFAYCYLNHLQPQMRVEGIQHPA